MSIVIDFNNQISIGDFFINKNNDLYILSQIYDKFALISLKSGNRWSDNCPDIENQEKLKHYIHMSGFSKICPSKLILEF